VDAVIGAEHDAAVRQLGRICGERPFGVAADRLEHADVVLGVGGRGEREQGERDGAHGAESCIASSIYAPVLGRRACDEEPAPHSRRRLWVPGPTGAGSAIAAFRAARDVARS